MYVCMYVSIEGNGTDVKIDPILHSYIKARQAVHLRLHLQLARTKPHWARVINYGTFTWDVIDDLCKTCLI
jgi:hypothetical protein